MSCETAEMVAGAWRAKSEATPAESGVAGWLGGARTRGASIPVVLFNGPPRCGKDTAAEALRLAIQGARHLKFAGAVKDATHAIFGLEVRTDAFEHCKDIPSPEFAGLTPRQAYIRFSEVAIKPAFGKTRFGHAAARRVLGAEDAGATLVAISDSGFAEETIPVIEAVGRENVLLIRIHRPGCTFDGDSRNYIYPPGIRSEDLSNEYTKAEWVRYVEAVVREWLAARRAA